MGLDLSEGMLRQAAASDPQTGFAVANAARLPLRDDVVGGFVAWYSLINMPTARLPAVFAEFARACRPGAPVVLAFQSGEGQRVDRDSAYGHAVPLTYYRHPVEPVAKMLVEAGFSLHATVHREPYGAHETTPQGLLLARGPEPT